METVQKQDPNSALTTLKTSYLSVIKDPVALVNHLRQFREKGVVKYDRVMCIETSQRLPALIREDRGFVATALCAALTGAFNSLNLKNSMSALQIANLAEEIMEESVYDNLAMEDVLLFLQQMLRGKYGTIYDRMDTSVFFEKFEAYREERHLCITRIREEEAANHQALGDTDRWSQDRDYEAHRGAMKEYLITKYGTHEGADNKDSAPGAGA